MAERVIYSREEIEERVNVPQIVEIELRHLIEERLRQCGMYYRLFSRIKTSSSLARKYQIKEYSESKKIQDLIGLRIDVYFEDDLSICQDFLEEMFHLVEWAESEQNDDEFRPMKKNGVFRLPDYLKKQISAETWDMCIDTTMEIQLKTVFFEGWHEIEHDMKYKGGELWEGKKSTARYFNSILATLELCDKSLVSLFENLGHDLYKEGNWAGMMKAHYRLKIEDRRMYPELEEILDNDHREKNIGKLLFKTKRQVLIRELLSLPRRIPINVNTITALVNNCVIHDERLDRLFHEKDVFNDGADHLTEEVSFRQMEPLRKNTVFHARVHLSTYKYTAQESCLEAARLTWQWMLEKYGSLFKELPRTPQNVFKEILGYRLRFTYEPERSYWKMYVTNVDLEAPGQIWVVEAECFPGERWQMLDVRNSYAVAEERRNYLNRYFSCPRFYSNIADRIGIFDVRYCSSVRRVIRPEQTNKIIDLIRHPKRSFPVCLFISREENGWLDEGWLDHFRIADFTKMAGRYTHIYTCNTEVGRAVIEAMGIGYDGEPGVHVFKAHCIMQDGTVREMKHVYYSPQDVADCSYGRQQLRSDGKRYDIVHGGQAFYYKLLHEMRDEMLIESDVEISPEAEVTLEEYQP